MYRVLQAARKQKDRPFSDGLFGANEQIRTADLIITNDVRYLLRHVSILSCYYKGSALPTANRVSISIVMSVCCGSFC